MKRERHLPLIKSSSLLIESFNKVELRKGKEREKKLECNNKVIYIKVVYEAVTRKEKRLCALLFRCE